MIIDCEECGWYHSEFAPHQFVPVGAVSAGRDMFASGGSPRPPEALAAASAPSLVGAVRVVPATARTTVRPVEPQRLDTLRLPAGQGGAS